MVNIHKEDIIKVYSGKAKTCCCGCAGKYWDNTPENKRQIDRIVEKLMTATDHDVCCTYIAAEVGSRLYIAYFE